VKPFVSLLSIVVVGGGIANAAAQVYSVNGVGYVNLTLPRGFSMVGNTLDAGSGNNVVSQLFAPEMLSAAPTDGRIYVFNASTGVYSIATFNSLTWAWDGAGALAEVPPGDGVFFLNVSDAALTCTFVGEVMQGAINVPIPQGFSIKCNPIPQRFDPDDPSLPPSERLPGGPGDRVYRFNPATGSYTTYTFSALAGGWIPSLPTFEVGEAFFIHRLNPPTSWIRTFWING
jgi:hypothetical protein